MRRNIRLLQPNSIADVSAMIALYRPGPMEHINTFVEAKHGRAAIQYPHEGLKDILEDTYGVIVYQDQVLLIAQEFGGYTLGEADILRKAMGKKIPEVMAAERDKFIAGAQRKGYAAGLATRIFDLNRAVRRIRVQQGPQHQLRHDRLLDGVLQGELSDRSTSPPCSTPPLATRTRSATCVREARRNKIDVLLPDVNHSTASFAIELTDGNRTAHPLRPRGGKERGSGRRHPDSGSLARRADRLRPSKTSAGGSIFERSIALRWIA